MSSDIDHNTLSDLMQLSPLQVAQATIPWLETHYWAFDLVRALALIALVALGIASPARFLQLVFIGLGVFLIIDGVLDIASGIIVRQGNAGPQARVAMGFLAIAAGIGVIVAHSVVAVALVIFLGIRLIVHGLINVAQSIAWLTARQRLGWIQVGEGVRWLWLGGLARVAVGAVTIAAYLLFIPIYSISLTIYLAVDALLNLYAAWLKSRPSQAGGYVPLTRMAPADAEVPLSDPALPGALRAVAFVRRSGANGLGHVAFAFEWPAGYFSAGSVENPGGAPFAKPDEMGFWVTNTLDPVAAMEEKVAPIIPYDEFKVFFVPHSSPDAAWSVLRWVSRQPYLVARRNCADAAYDALRAYGTPRLVDPAQKSVPNEWYDRLPGLSYRIREHPSLPTRPGANVPKAVALRVGLAGSTPEMAASFGSSAVTPPHWRASRSRALYELTAQLEYVNERGLRFAAWLATGATRLVAHLFRMRRRSSAASR
ncbi:MAG TPA: hypothetical protein VF807_01315 [Ktedonobacterales bacterium]